MRRVLSVLTVATAVITLPVSVRVQSSPATEKLGNVHFETSCGGAVEGDFDHAMALLHSFEFPAAISGFEQVLKSDPGCGIAEWGIAMSVWGNPFSGLRSAKSFRTGRQRSIVRKPSARRRARTRIHRRGGVALSNADTNDQRARTMAYEQAMEQIYTKYPDDLEATAFYALAVDQDALPTDKTFANQLKAAAILERLFQIEPDHPGVTHYLIHSYDVPSLAARGLPYAGGTRTSHPTRRTRSTCQRTRSRASVSGRSRSTPTFDRTMPPSARRPRRSTARDGLHGCTRTSKRRRTPRPSASSTNWRRSWRSRRRRHPAQDSRRISWHRDSGPLRARTQSLVSRDQSPGPSGLAALHRSDDALRPRHGRRPPERLDILKTELDQLAMLRDKEIVAKDHYWTTQVEIQRQEVEAWMLWVQGGKNQALKTMAGCRDARGYDREIAP